MNVVWPTEERRGEEESMLDGGKVVRAGGMSLVLNMLSLGVCQTPARKQPAATGLGWPQ